MYQLWGLLCVFSLMGIIAAAAEGRYGISLATCILFAVSTYQSAKAVKRL